MGPVPYNKQRDPREWGTVFYELRWHGVARENWLDVAERDALPSRKPLRLCHYDYSLPGDYFLTVCIIDKRCVLGRVDQDVVQVSPLGRMVQSIWRQIPENSQSIQLDECIVMPNHLHGILHIIHRDWMPSVGDGSHPVPCSIPAIVGRFKTLTTKRYREGIEGGLWRDFGRRLWQRSYFDRIIRNRDELHQVRWYIRSNPARWGGSG